MGLRGALLLAVVPLAIAACAPVTRPSGSARATLAADPARRARIQPRAPARLVPIDVAENKSLGVEPGGGARAIAAGVRVVSLLGGAVASAEDRLPGTRWEVIALPERLGGGFLFKIEDKSIWRADKWLARARPIYAPSTTITRVVPGLDRVYVLAGGWHAFDGSTGEAKPLGPWPASPTVSAYAAADGWRAVAIVDFRGAVTTNDAGATWHPLSLPIEPHEVSSKGEVLEIRGAEPGRGDTSYEVRPDGQVLRAQEATTAPLGSAERVTLAAAVAPGSLGAHALVAAVDDGWPLEDGTALVARDGTLSRVRLEDGAVVEAVPGAFSLRPSRCHPMPMGAPGQVGFLCGEPRGATVLYSFDPAAGAMVEVRRFDEPRAVLPSGNGAIAVHGSCDPHAPGDADPDARHYCVRPRDGAWREIRVEGGNGRERVAVLGDGRFAIVSPPQRGVDAGSLTIVEAEHAQSVPIAISGVSADVARVLAVGVWLDGIEERKPGVLGGWIEAAGTMLGFELGLDGAASFGQLIRGESLLPMVSGRYGLGWSGTHGGFETTNGGMTWAPVAVPEPIKPLREVASRACGPIGCSAAGWLRVGWGEEPATEPQAVPSRPRLPRPSPSLTLDCASGDAGGRGGTSGDFLGAPPPSATSKDSRLLAYETTDTLERAPRTGPLARVYAWGPKSGEWDHAARWLVRWAWPFGGASDMRSSAVAQAPTILLEAARGAGTLGIPFSFLSLAIAPGDDPSHALLVTRRGPRTPPVLFELEAERAPVEIKRGDGELLGEIESAVRESGRWYLATSSRQSGRTESVVWQVDGGVVRELARIPRTAAPDGRVSTARLAPRGDGRALGIVVDGQPLGERSEPTRWMAPIDLDTGAVGEVELLGPFDLGAQRAVTLCTNDESGGFALDVGLSGNNAFPITVSSPAARAPATLAGAIARVRLTPSRVCIERLAGSLVSRFAESSGHQSSPPATPASITVTLTDGSGDAGSRRVFRCGVR